MICGLGNRRPNREFPDVVLIPGSLAKSFVTYKPRNPGFCKPLPTSMCKTAIVF